MPECAVCYAQLDVGALASFELVARELQIREDRLSHGFESAAAEHHREYPL